MSKAIMKNADSRKEKVIPVKTTKKINSEWSEYDRIVALSQLTNYGVIFLDAYDLPIDDEYELEELNQRRIKIKCA